MCWDWNETGERNLDHSRWTTHGCSKYCTLFATVASGLLIKPIIRISFKLVCDNNKSPV